MTEGPVDPIVTHFASRLERELADARKQRLLAIVDVEAMGVYISPQRPGPKSLQRAADAAARITSLAATAVKRGVSFVADGDNSMVRVMLTEQKDASSDLRNLGQGVSASDTMRCFDGPGSFVALHEACGGCGSVVSGDSCCYGVC